MASHIGCKLRESKKAQDARCKTKDNRLGRQGAESNVQHRTLNIQRRRVCPKGQRGGVNVYSPLRWAQAVVQAKGFPRCFKIIVKDAPGGFSSNGRVLSVLIL